MTYKSNYEIQGRFKFFDNEEQLRRDWKQHARANIRQKTFLEGILLKSLDPDSKFLHSFDIDFCLRKCFIVNYVEILCLRDNV